MHHDLPRCVGQSADHHQRLHDQRRSEQRRLQAGHCHLSGRQHDLQRHGQDAERHRHAGGAEREPAPVRYDRSRRSGRDLELVESARRVL